MARRTPPLPPALPLEKALVVAYGAEPLKALARLAGVRGGTRKAEVAAALAGALLRQPGRLRELWEALDPLQQAAVAEALHHGGGVFDAPRFRAKYGAGPSWGKLDAWRPSPELLCLFLLPLDRAFRIPPDLMERLRRLVPEPREEVLQTLDEPRPPPALEHEDEPLRLHDGQRVARQELFAVLRLVDRGKVRVSEKTRRPSAKGMEAVRDVLVGGDYYGPEHEPAYRWAGTIGPMRAFAWPLILQAGGLAKPSGTRLELTAAGRKAPALPAHETLRRLWGRWVSTSLLDEFSRIEAIKGQSDRKRLTAVAGRRAVVAEALAACPPGRWVAVDELFRHMQAAGLDFYVAHDLWKLYIADRKYGSLGYAGFHDWPILQGRYVLAVLFEYAATLGLVDLAYTAPSRARADYRGMWGIDDLEFLSLYDGLACFRVNELGAYVLGEGACYEPPAVEPRSGLRVLPNLEVVAASGRFDPGDEALLGVFCARRSEAVFSLDRSTALAAVEQGHRVGELRSFLEQASQTGLPDTARAFLDDLARRAGMLRLSGSAVLVECEDPAVARRLARGSRTGRLCTLVGESTLVVPAAKEAAFRRAALAEGYPLPSGPGGAAGGR